ncbi:hypothetical protein CAPN002_00270 [Capnocytophaga stomatis]|uniref:hypothetical protein n=1 Tax=Capnocytophaga stomatis TaxID=1848904 RepID=UPI0019527A7F|nr:hypothetical protein [Capnocytophaga stomatis]GIJ92809.1 hypothetical protein CAPN002_00270 [Capnocytophaga stomatis]
MTNEIRNKIAKVYELVKRGEQCERQVAEKALERLLKKHNLSSEEVSKIHLKLYKFKYSSDLDKKLLLQLLTYFFEGKHRSYTLYTGDVREIGIEMEYLDYVQVECAYEYFKRHMNQQWREFALPLVKKKRTTKTKNRRRKELQDVFFSKYILSSKIYLEKQVCNRSNYTQKELEDLYALSGVEGGKFNGQLFTGLHIENE